MRSKKIKFYIFHVSLNNFIKSTYHWLYTYNRQQDLKVCKIFFILQFYVFFFNDEEEIIKRKTRTFNSSIRNIEVGNDTPLARIRFSWRVKIYATSVRIELHIRT